LRRAKLPLYEASIDVDAALRAMELDKKRRDGQIRFALPQRLGQVVTQVALDPAQVRAAVAQCATAPQAEELGE
jgi:3-dehydroquinate synthetase